MSRLQKRSRQKQPLFRRIFTVCVICCLTFVISSCLFAEDTGNRPLVKIERRVQALPGNITQEPIDPPARLLIPSIQIDTVVERVGILANGELGVAQQDPWNHTGWYEHGPKPGERGSSVIDGHLNRPGGEPAIFSSLNKLQPGDEVIVITQIGRTLRFEVNRLEQYRPQEAPLQSIFGNNSGYYLNLITCAGDWIPAEQQTTLRLVVYASLVT